MTEPSAYSLERVETEADWAAYHRIRREVLFEQRGLLNRYDPDHPDEHADGLYPLLLKRNGVPIGTVRLDTDGGAVGIVRLVAIDQQEQGKGHGRVLLQHVETMAHALGLTQLDVNAAPDAETFYAKVGYVAVGKNGEAVLMRKSLAGM